MEVRKPITFHQEGTKSFKTLGELGAVNEERKASNEELEVRGEGAVASASFVAFFQDLRHNLSFLISKHNIDNSEQTNQHLPSAYLPIARGYRNRSTDHRDLLPSLASSFFSVASDMSLYLEPTL
ncbi:hypothetical protein PIB30_093306 [Stylosanthes scabra]|uniref:Uncharacterized protein n=1 Tax=Stylosanthes scabra TaxID=79078 RepID=A0ABU6RVD8_9FABA|nr:hypothetical protein [Stylosanthes scabra]